MSSRRISVALAYILVAVFASARAAESPTGMENAAVSLRYNGDVALSEEDSEALFRKGMEVLGSSQFNSASPQWEWDYAKVNAEYEQALSGRHLLVTFAEPKKIKTMGGYVQVWKLIIGLNGNQYASPVHTVDGNGVVTGHAKYEGTLCVKLLDLVKEVVIKKPSNSLVPARDGEAPLLAAQQQR